MAIKNSKLTKIIKTISLTLSFLLLGLFVLFVLVESFLPNQTMNIFGVKSYIVKYDTMEPTIKPYDLVFIKRVDTDNLEVGDFITFRASIQYDGVYQLVTYYVSSTAVNTNDERIYYTVAEAPSIPYAFPVQSSSVVGGYAFRIPLLGYFIEFIQTGYGIAAIVINIIIISGIVIVVKLGKKEKIEAPQ